VLVRPGERIPSDGVVVEGESHVNEALLTGESRPVRRGVGDKIIGGAINEEGSLKVRIERTGSETFVAQVMRLIRQAQESRSRTQDLANRASALLFYIAMGSGVATFLAWHALGNPDIAIERMVTVLVVACPHALGLAIPLVVATSTSITSKSGILIRDRRAFEGIRDVDAVVFDKTGTLTQGSFGVTDVISFIPHDELLRLTSNVEVNSEHIIAKAIVSYARERGIEILGPDEFKAMPGKGVSGVVGGRTVHVGGPSLLKDMGLEDADQSLRELQNQGKTVVFTLVDGKVVGAFALSDKVREESREALRRLREMGVAVFMITGDSEDVARWVAKELGIENYFAQVLPGEKAERVSSLKRAGYKVAMVGDGINDAPALVTADVGIAIGAGTDVAIESADIILVRNDPRDVVKVIEFSKKAYSKMVQNLWWATGYNAFTIPLAAGALSGLGITLSPAVGALLMSLSTVIVAVNAQTLRKYEPKIQIKAGEVHTVIDPVCGMEVEPDTAYSKLDYEGNLIYFCSEACEKKFREDPNKYLGRLKRGERRYRF
jgi:Cu2+-exporting ATPase